VSHAIPKFRSRDIQWPLAASKKAMLARATVERNDFILDMV